MIEELHDSKLLTQERRLASSSRPPNCISVPCLCGTEMIEDLQDSKLRVSESFREFQRVSESFKVLRISRECQSLNEFQRVSGNFREAQKVAGSHEFHRATELQIVSESLREPQRAASQPAEEEERRAREIAEQVSQDLDLELSGRLELVGC